MRRDRGALTLVLVVLCAAGLTIAGGKGGGKQKQQQQQDQPQQQKQQKQEQPKQQQGQQKCKNDAVTWNQLAETPNSPGMFTSFLRQDLDGDGRFECVRLKFKNTNDTPVKFEGAWTLDMGHDVKAKQWSFVLAPGESTSDNDPDLFTCLSGQSMAKNDICKPGINITNANVTQQTTGDANAGGGGR